MNIFPNIISGYDYRSVRSSQFVIVCTHATYSTHLLCLALKSEGLRVVFLPVSYSKKQEYIDILKNDGVEVIAQDDLQKLMPKVDFAIEDGARISKFIFQHKLEVKKTFFTVEQTTGGIRYLASHPPNYPVIDVALSPLKLDIENRRATPESVIQQYSEQTGQTLGGKRVLIVGFGSIGEGLARLARVLGARVTIYDNSSVRTVFARHRGYHIASSHTLNSIMGIQDVIFMATNRYAGDLLDVRRILLLKDKTVIVNAGSGRGELDMRIWEPSESEFHDAKLKVEKSEGNITVFSEKAGQNKKVIILGSGYPINLHLGKGTSHDAIQFVMAMLFLAGLEGPDNYEKGIQPLSSNIQEHIAASYVRLENPNVFEPTYVRTKDLELGERPYGGVYPFHSHLNDKAHFAVVRAWFKAESKTRGHYHLRSQEAYYAIKGVAVIMTWKHDEPNALKQAHKMQPGDYLLVPEGYFHDVVVEGSEDFETLVISSPSFQIWDQFFEEEINE